jgi:hypothetical protein
VIDHPSGSYIIDAGPHEGHTAKIVARDMPGDRVTGAVVPENWVVCECGEAWGYVDSSADELAKDSL